jgi:hypothetical protein
VQVVFAFVLVAIVFIPIGIACLIGSQDVSLSVTLRLVGTNDLWMTISVF